MPSKKKKYNARFPAGRIKKIMQTDEDVGKVAQAVPIIISRTLELFVHSLLTKTMQITSNKNAKTLSTSHMKQCILSESRFDFLKDLVKSVPDVSNIDDEVQSPPMTPAPTGITSINPPLNITRVQPEIRIPKELTITRKSTEVNNHSQDCLEAIKSNIKLEEAAPSPNRVPNFQIAIPSSFNDGKPNFYTEVNPLNLSTQQTKEENSSLINVNSIDEDYDT
ncbi:negative cofactor 2 alpha [Cotesia typhae]|uniref:negative cofactor 2 alpha n=1 Tax=Cotesia typhae TaxID=2053667 RepID=UPI003D69473D